MSDEHDRPLRCMICNADRWHARALIVNGISVICFDCAELALHSVAHSPLDAPADEDILAGCSCGAKFTATEDAHNHECPLDEDEPHHDGGDR